jgi:hypothetical protein
MGELLDRDQEHLRLLKLGYYITAAGIAGLALLFSLLWIGMGALLASGAFPAKEGSSDNPQLAGLFFLGIGVAFLKLGLAMAFLTYFAGRSLADRRRWMFCMVVAALCCLQIPWGSVLGACTIIVLSRPSVKALFGHPGPPQPDPTRGNAA